MKSMPFMSKLKWLKSSESSSGNDISAGFQAEVSPGKRMKSSSALAESKEVTLLGEACDVSRDTDGAELLGLGFCREEEVFAGEVEVLDISLCDLRWEGSHWNH